MMCTGTYMASFIIFHLYFDTTFHRQKLSNSYGNIIHDSRQIDLIGSLVVSALAIALKIASVSLPSRSDEAVLT